MELQWAVTVAISCVVGGGEDLRRYWSEYLLKTHVLVYVVDSSDRSRLPLARAELHRLLKVDAQLPVVVLGNKQVIVTAVISPCQLVASLPTAHSLASVARLVITEGSVSCLRTFWLLWTGSVTNTRLLHPFSTYILLR